MGSIWRTVDRPMLRDVALVCLAVGAVGLSYGAIAVSSGMPTWLPVLSAVLVLAGSSEFLFVGIIAAGGSPIAAVFAGLLVNARHLPFGLAVPEVVGAGWRRVVGTHLMNDESVVFALAESELARKRAVYWACGIGVLICWPIGALFGALIGAAIHNTNALGLDAMFPAALLALVLPSLRECGMWQPALIGVAIALGTAAFLPAGLPVLLALIALGFTVTRKEKRS